tara:strand:+ start:1989 stop:2705 length:717 start_codon:yes stop_codon:yes gene_type:complete
MSCRVCLEEETDGNKFVSPCKCKGDAGNIHEKCLIQWIETSDRQECEICNTPYSKKEVSSFQLKKYFCGCFSVDCNPYNTRLFILNFIFSCFFLISSSIEDMKIITYITLSIMYVFSLAFFIKQQMYNTEELFTIDSLFIWKLSYTLSLALVMTIVLLDNSSQCEQLCEYVHKKTCDNTCPSYTNLYAKEEYKVQKLFMFDLINNVIIIILRSVVLCHKYNKKTVFSDYHEETEPLIV